MMPCPECGRDVQNVVVHRRFCSTRKACPECGKTFLVLGSHLAACRKRTAVRRGWEAYAEHAGLRRGSARAATEDEAYEAVDRALARLGWSWAHLCKASTISKQTVAYWQKHPGSLRLAAMVEIAAVLGVPVSELLRDV